MRRIEVHKLSAWLWCVQFCYWCEIKRTFFCSFCRLSVLFNNICGLFGQLILKETRQTHSENILCLWVFFSLLLRVDLFFLSFRKKNYVYTSNVLIIKMTNRISNNRYNNQPKLLTIQWTTIMLGHVMFQCMWMMNSKETTTDKTTTFAKAINTIIWDLHYRVWSLRCSWFSNISFLFRYFVKVCVRMRVCNYYRN